MVIPLHETYVSMVHAFKADCDSLIEKFQEKKSEDFRDFVPIWKAFKFHLIYEKYTNIGMYYDFKEDTLQIAKCIMLHHHFVGGIFLLYGLYYVQEDPKPCIRIEYEEFVKLLKLVKQERNTVVETCQPGYLLAKLLKNDAFAFVRFQREYSMEGQSRARLVFNSKPVTSERQTVDPGEWLKGFLKDVDFVDKLKLVEKTYFEKKQKLKKEHPELNLALDMVPSDFISGLKKNLSLDNLAETKHKPTIGEKRWQLKNRKMTKHRKKIGRRPKMHTEHGAPKKRRGPPVGKRSLYYMAMVNDPDSDSGQSRLSDPDDPKLSLPDL